MSFNLKNNELRLILDAAENEILSAKRIKFEKDKSWRENNVPSYPGIYALFEGKENLLYVGETGNLRDRMNDICRTVNHTFRKQLGHKRFGGVKSKKKFNDEIELQLDQFFTESLYVSFITANFGRTEIETFLVTKYQDQLLNSEKKRKLKLVLDELEEEIQPSDIKKV